MKLRTAAICASCLLSAALKTSLKPFSSDSASFNDSVLALRHPLSEPVCANPTVMIPSSAAGVFDPAQPVSASATAPAMASPPMNFFFISKTSLFGTRRGRILR